MIASKVPVGVSHNSVAFLSCAAVVLTLATVVLFHGLAPDVFLHDDTTRPVDTCTEEWQDTRRGSAYMPMLNYLCLESESTFPSRCGPGVSMIQVTECLHHLLGVIDKDVRSVWMWHYSRHTNTDSLCLQEDWDDTVHVISRHLHDVEQRLVTGDFLKSGAVTKLVRDWHMMKEFLFPRNEYVDIDGVQHIKRNILRGFKFIQYIETCSGLQDYRYKIFTKIRNEIYRNLTEIFHRADCEDKTDRRLVASGLTLDGWGLGAVLRHVVVGYKLAYVTKRRLIVDDRTNWLLPSQWYKLYREPGKRPCNVAKALENVKLVGWNAHKPGDLNVEFANLTVDKGTNPAIMVKDPFVDKHVLHSIRHHHVRPYTWWTGVFTKYMMRLPPSIAGQYENTRSKIGFPKCVRTIKDINTQHSCEGGRIVGIHVRRGDKVNSEGQFFTIDKYFDAAEEYFQLREAIEGKALARRVYLACDELATIDEASTNYPHYDIIFNMEAAFRATVRERRNVFQGSVDVTIEMLFLAKVDYLVCTLSSNVGHTVYSLRAARFGSQSPYLTYSLDIDYTIPGGDVYYSYHALTSSSKIRDKRCRRRYLNVSQNETLWTVVDHRDIMNTARYYYGEEDNFDGYLQHAYGYQFNGMFMLSSRSRQRAGLVASVNVRELIPTVPDEYYRVH